MKPNIDLAIMSNLQDFARSTAWLRFSVEEWIADELELYREIILPELDINKGHYELSLKDCLVNAAEIGISYLTHNAHGGDLDKALDSMRANVDNVRFYDEQFCRGEASFGEKCAALSYVHGTVVEKALGNETPDLDLINSGIRYHTTLALIWLNQLHELEKDNDQC